MVPKAKCYNSYNYASERDIVPYGRLLPDLANTGRLVQDVKNLEELIILEAHPDAPLFDHEFDSPTFKEVMERHIRIYIEQYGSKQ